MGQGWILAWLLDRLQTKDLIKYLSVSFHSYFLIKKIKQAHTKLLTTIMCKNAHPENSVFNLKPDKMPNYKKKLRHKKQLKHF